MKRLWLSVRGKFLHRWIRLYRGTIRVGIEDPLSIRLYRKLEEDPDILTGLLINLLDWAFYVIWFWGRVLSPKWLPRTRRLHEIVAERRSRMLGVIWEWEE